MKDIFIIVIFLLIPALSTAESSRFFYSGDGKISLRSAQFDASFRGAYRNPDGTYRDEAIKKINRVFGISPVRSVDSYSIRPEPFDMPTVRPELVEGERSAAQDRPVEGRTVRVVRRCSPHASTGSARTDNYREIISLRLIEFLDYLQDKLGGKTITIASGYRSPEYNTSLRENGALAAKASLHQYGMATDFQMAGVSSKQIWEYVRELGFGGAGYYHGKNVHVDVGPARFWDEKTSGVGTDAADDNKVIMLVTDRDIYKPGETINLMFARMTAWPIGVEPEFVLERVPSLRAERSNPLKSIRLLQSFGPRNDNHLPDSMCRIFNDPQSMLNIPWQTPADLAPGRYAIRAKFCEKKWEAMPAEITTNEFEIYHRDTGEK